MREALINFFKAIAKALGGDAELDGEVSAESENAVTSKAIFMFVTDKIDGAFYVNEGSEAI